MTEELIVRQLCGNSEYFSNVYGHILPSDFESKSSRLILKAIDEVYKEYNKAPSLDELMLHFESKSMQIQDKMLVKTAIDDIRTLKVDVDDKLLLNTSERYIKNKRFRDLLILGSDVVDGTNKTESLESIQVKSEEINKLSFKKSAGLDYKKDAMKNFLEYSKVVENGISSHLSIVNTAIGNVFLGGTLHLYASVSNGGKTILLVNDGANAMRQGKNVAYFTFEEKEIEIRERFDACLMDRRTDEFRGLGQSLNTDFERLMSEGIGDLKIKAYGPRSASALTVKAQLEDWRLKENFIPDMIILDSITIIAPTAKSESLYGTGKAVSEEIKALGVLLDVPMISAIQLGRGVYGASKVGMEDVSESLAVAQVASSMIGVVIDEHRPEIRLLSIIKSRKVNKAKEKAQNVNIDTDKQRVWDMTDNEKKRPYIKQEQKAQLEEMNHVAEIAEKLESVDDIEDDLLTQLLNS